MKYRIPIRVVAFRCLLTFLACCVAVSDGAVNRIVKTSRDARAASISRVCLVSLEAQLNRIGMKGAEPLLPEGEEWRRKLRDVVSHSVTGSGWTLAGDLSAGDLSAGDLLADDPGVDEQLRSVVLRIKQRYDTVAVQMNKKPGSVEKGRYTLGDEVARLPCSASADSLLFVRAEGLIETGGRKAFSLLLGGSMGVLMAQSKYKLSIAFVDATTGQVTVFTRISLLGGKAGEDPERVLNDRLVEEFAKMRPAGRTP